jgi:SPP1 gp7 family putative phage head morphogenesis protein
MTCAAHQHLQEQGDPLAGFSMRKLLANTNGKILDALLRHRHFILRAENGVLRDLVRSLNAAERTIRAEIARIAALHDAASDFSKMRLGALQDMEAVIAQALRQAEVQIGGASTVAFQQFAMREWEIQAGLLGRIIPSGLSFDLTGGDLARALAIVSEPLGGKFWGDRLTGDFRELENEMRRSLATSFALGEGIEDAVRRLGTVTENTGRQRLAMIARTEMQRVANRAAMDMYERNHDTVKAVQVIETLDDRTCLICALKDGQVVPVGSSDVPPYHPNCRGYITPVVRSLPEMGLDPNDFPPSVAANLDGKPSDRVLYPEWFAGQSQAFQREWLGASRFARFKAGELKLQDMVKDLRILSLDELPLRSLQ